MGYVYLLCDPSNNTYKIGVTRKKDISKRLKKLQTGNSTEIFIRDFYECEYPFKLEKFLHVKFRNKNELGEWFNLSIDDIIKFKTICKESELILNSLQNNPFITLK